MKVLHGDWRSLVGLDGKALSLSKESFLEMREGVFVELARDEDFCGGEVLLDRCLIVGNGFELLAGVVWLTLSLGRF